MFCVVIKGPMELFLLVTPWPDQVFGFYFMCVIAQAGHMLVASPASKAALLNCFALNILQQGSVLRQRNDMAHFSLRDKDCLTSFDTTGRYTSARSYRGLQASDSSFARLRLTDFAGIYICRECNHQLCKKYARYIIYTAQSAVRNLTQQQIIPYI